MRSAFIACLFDLLSFPFSGCRFYAPRGFFSFFFRFGRVWLVSVRPVTVYLISSLVMFVRIGIKPINILYLEVFVLPGPAFCFYGKMLCFL